MISSAAFCDFLAKHDVSQFYGVPDSLLKSLCAYIDNTFATQQHVITANEGNAMAMAAGYYLGSGQPAVVYMQNSGLGNIVNPMTSLCDPQVYSIPMLLVIGWRGEPGVKDEPQHVKQGEITPEQLSLLDIPYEVIDQHADIGSLAPLLSLMTEQSRPVAVVVKKGSFATVKAAPRPNAFSLKREAALSALLDVLAPQTLVVSTTGKTSREVFELRKAKGHANSDFLTVGGMGHTASIALGVAMSQPNRQVIAIDGDGSVLMHMGALAVIGSVAPKNFIHVVLNNQSHESVGGQPTVMGNVDLQAISRACGYQHYLCATAVADIEKALVSLNSQTGPALLEIKIAQGARDDLGRPTSSPQENKHAFMHHAGSAIT